MNRREFAAALATGLMVPRALAAGPGHPVPGRSADHPTPGIQLYTLRSLMAKDVEQTLATVADMGYREVEFAGYFGRRPEQIRDALTNLDLLAPSAHVDIEALGSTWSQTIDRAAVMGHRYLILAWIAPARRGSIDGWRRLGDQLNEAGELAARAGITIGYHNHDFEFAPVDGRLPYDVLLKATDPNLVTLELDLYWIIKAGGDPVAYFEKGQGRYSMVHVKDMDATPARGMTDPGKGIIEFEKILPAAAAAGVRHWFIEHDQPADPLATARQGIAFFQTTTL
jgi:sugar phosphate isomerase/epimerase